MFPQGVGSKSQRFCPAAPVLHKYSSQRRARRTPPETSEYVTITYTYKQHHMTLHSSASTYRSEKGGMSVEAFRQTPSASLCSRQHSVNKALPLRDTPLSAPRAKHYVIITLTGRSVTDMKPQSLNVFVLLLWC